MGKIHREVETRHLRDYPQEVVLLYPFLHGFDVTWASRRRHYNTDLSLYFLSPLQGAGEQFGLNAEVMLAISDSRTMQPRVIQAIERCLADEPALGRVYQTLFFIVTSDPEAEHFLREYTANNAQARIPVLFQRETLNREASSWFVRNVIAGQLFSRDLFDYKLPLDSDLIFFGRDALVADFVDAAKKSENRGLFGLRKTGKTSVLKKVMRLCETTGNVVLYYDCKFPAVRNLSWSGLLERITSDTLRSVSRPTPSEFHGAHVSDQFATAIRLVPKKKNVTLIFDEIEYISPMTCALDQHWNDDFVPFWQTLWATQSEYRRLSFFIAGVNPSVTEKDTFSGIQNPMFGIVKPLYLSGFTEPELKTMLEYFGHRMGLRFTSDAIEYLLERYGGHPLLTRMACSHANTEVSIRKVERPVRIARHFLAETEQEREQEISFYCGHVLSELRDYYPDEYEMLGMLASGNMVDFSEFAVEPQYVQHLREYGLVKLQRGRRPVVRIPVLQKYIALEFARKNKQSIQRYIVPADGRKVWLQQRVKKIIQDLRDLELIVEKNQLPPLYGRGGIYEAEAFYALTPANCAQEFDHFINVCNRCLVEPLQNRGASGKRVDYVGGVIKDAYPELWDALERIRVYRHNAFHIALRQSTDEVVQRYLSIDLGGRRAAQVDELHFLLQQCVIDGLYMGARCEIDRLG